MTALVLMYHGKSAMPDVTYIIGGDLCKLIPWVEKSLAVVCKGGLWYHVYMFTIIIAQQKHVHADNAVHGAFLIKKQSEFHSPVRKPLAA